MKLKALFLFLTLPFLTMAEPKNLSVEDVDFDLIRMNRDRETVNVRITWQRDQFISIRDRNDSKIEARFYVSKKRGQEKRIMKEKDYYLPSAISSFTLSPREACSTPGTHWARVRFLVQTNQGQRNNNYELWKDSDAGSFSYACRDKNEFNDLNINAQLKLKDQDDDGRNDQLNLLLDMDPNQLNRIQRTEGSVHLELFAYRDNQKVRIKNKAYNVKQAKSSYIFSLRDFCGEIQNFWDWLGGTKEVAASCRVTVQTENGGLDHRYGDYICPQERFTCIFD